MSHGQGNLDPVQSNNTYTNSPTYDESAPVPSASIKSQLATWHSNRNNKSFLRAMIPTWHTPPAGEERVTKNPFKLLGMVGPFAWMMFFSGWLAWTMDGYE
jgi:SHS family lactate transporter-like MFS transporter